MIRINLVSSRLKWAVECVSESGAKAILFGRGLELVKVGTGRLGEKKEPWQGAKLSNRSLTLGLPAK